MGYRSEVAYVIRFRNKDLRDGYVNLVMAKGDANLTAALNDCHIPLKDNQPTICFYAEAHKWYGGDHIVLAHTELLNWARELYGEDCDYRFVRIGEEPNDIEEDSTSGDQDDYEDAYAVSTIEVSFPKEYRWMREKGGKEEAEV